VHALQARLQLRAAGDLQWQVALAKRLLGAREPLLDGLLLRQQGRRDFPYSVERPT
jgi:hypothetical protein